MPLDLGFKVKVDNSLSACLFAWKFLCPHSNLLVPNNPPTHLLSAAPALLCKGVLTGYPAAEISGEAWADHSSATELICRDIFDVILFIVLCHIRRFARRR